MSPLRCTLGLLLALLALGVARAHDGAAPDILRADAARVAAMLANDIDALDALLTADCLYVHSNGFTQTKREFLAALTDGEMRYTTIEYAAPPRVRRYGEHTAIVTGTTHLAVKLADGRTLKPTLLITAVYIFADGRWQLATYQSTPAPSAP